MTTPYFRKKRVALAFAISLLALGGFGCSLPGRKNRRSGTPENLRPPPSTPPSLTPSPLTLPAREGSSWDALRKMYAAVQGDPNRSEQLFSERYYTEDFSSGAPPLPYRAYRRIRVSYRTEERERLIVVTRQQGLPFQEDSEFRNYHSPCFVEEELVFDEGWGFRRAREWRWTAPPEASEAGLTTLTYGWWASRSSSGDREARAEGKSIHIYEGGKEIRTFPLDESRPPAEAVLILFVVAADLVRGARIESQDCWKGTRNTFAVDDRAAAAGPSDTTLLPPARVAVKETGGDWSSHNYISHDFTPSTQKYGYSHSQCGWDFSPTTRAAYRRCLAKFLKDFGIEELRDDHDVVIDLPLGLEE